MTLITLGYRNGAVFRLRDTGEEVKIIEVASSEEEIVRNAAGEWVGLRVQGQESERWVCESELAPL